jgi:RimJ/RimL family protein N-acetyltransferase
MLRLLFDQDKPVADFVAAMIPHVRRLGFGPNVRAIGVIDEDGTLLGGMVYHNWDPEAGIIEMSGAAVSPRWLTRRTLAAMFSYAFGVCSVQQIMMRTPIENERVLRQLAAYGFEFIKIPRMFGRDRDGMLCLLTDDEWAHNKFNKRYKLNLLQQEAA